MSLQAGQDIPVRVFVPADSTSNSTLISAERRISPSWTVGQLKTKLEPVTGIPPSCQRLRTKHPLQSWVVLDDDESLVGSIRWSLKRESEIEVTDLRPPSTRHNFTDVSTVEKYQMPESQYQQLTDSVLAWKKRQKLGRFNPSTKSLADLIEDRKSRDEGEIKAKGIKIGDRCRLGTEDGRRGTVRFIGPVDGLGGDREAGCRWIGVELDEPLGRHNGSVKVCGDNGKEEIRQLFDCREKYGVVVRPEKVEVGDWPPLDDLEIDEDMEEL